jgi:hypothetical protein
LHGLAGRSVQRHSGHSYAMCSLVVKHYFGMQSLDRCVFPARIRYASTSLRPRSPSTSSRRCRAPAATMTRSRSSTIPPTARGSRHLQRRMDLGRRQYQGRLPIQRARAALPYLWNGLPPSERACDILHEVGSVDNHYCSTAGFFGRQSPQLNPSPTASHACQNAQRRFFLGWCRGPRRSEAPDHERPLVPAAVVGAAVPDVRLPRERCPSRASSCPSRTTRL